MNLKDIRIGSSLYDSLREKLVVIEMKHFRELSISENCFKARYQPIKLSEGILFTLRFEARESKENTIHYESLIDVNISIVYVKDINQYTFFWGGKPFKKIKFLHQLENLL